MSDGALSLLAEVLIAKEIGIGGFDSRVRKKRSLTRFFRRLVMPRGDGTGPAGQDPRTGRGAGSCPPQQQTGMPGMIGVPGHGNFSGNFGGGQGPCGRGMRRGFGPARQGR